MFIERLQLTNFRGFEEIDLHFTGRTTVLIGENGAGKSAILDALLQLLRPLPRMFRAELEGSYPIDSSLWTIAPIDRRNNTDRTRLALTVRTEGLPAGIWAMDTEPVKDHQKHQRKLFWVLYERGDGGGSELPTFAYYPVDRQVTSGLAREPGPLDDAVIAFKSFEQGRSDYDQLFNWFRSREDIENESLRDDSRFRDPQLSAVRRALESLVPGFENLRVRRVPSAGGPFSYFKRPVLLVDKGDTTLAVDQLSHGERGLIALVGDLTRRLALTHPNLADPLQGDGIALIDELALHLHPRWQRDILPALERTFPNLQFIVTTHSPQVIANVDRSNVRVLEDNRLISDAPHTYGRDANAILSDLMGLEPHPVSTRASLRTIAEMIDSEDYDAARDALDNLAESLGENDVTIVHQRSLLELLAE